MSDNREKIKRLAKYVKENPGDSFSKFALALELQKNNQLEKALTLFESIYRNDPDYLGIYYHLGKLYQSLNRSADAGICFREGIERSGNQNDHRTLSELQDALKQLNEEINHENE